MAVLSAVCPKLPMRNKLITRQFYLDFLGFEDISAFDYPNYLIVARDGLELHFFLHSSLDPFTNDGQVYFRVLAVDALFEEFITRKTPIQNPLELKPWHQKEFSLIDPDHNLLTFGESF